MKDPAVLLYVNDWLNSTAAMEADCRGWYLNLILHNYDKGSLPNDIETLAVLCNVKYSEFARFEQVFKQVLEKKFEQNDDGTISNARTQKILQAREVFKDKRSEAGKKSYLIRFFAKKYPKQYKVKALKDFVLENIDTSIDLKNEQVLEQVFEQMFELYRNANANEDVNTDNEILDFFNNTCAKLPKVKILTDARKTKLRNRIKEFGTDKVKEIFEDVSKSNFLNGENNNNWTATFDWILEPKNFTKILEGNYKNKENGTHNNTKQSNSNGSGYSTGRNQLSKGGKITASQMVARAREEAIARHSESRN